MFELAHRFAAVALRARRLEQRNAIAALKQACPLPEVVEVWDTTSPDPALLVWLKAARNAVPVPRHWSQKRAYLAGKRGLEKPPFQLPAFIEATGIGEMRAAYAEKEDAKKLKNKTRDRLQPKMGKLDIDYQAGGRGRKGWWAWLGWLDPGPQTLAVNASICTHPARCFPVPSPVPLGRGLVGMRGGGWGCQAPPTTPGPDHPPSRPPEKERGVGRAGAGQASPPPQPLARNPWRPRPPGPTPRPRPRPPPGPA